MASTDSTNGTMDVDDGNSKKRPREDKQQFRPTISDDERNNKKLDNNSILDQSIEPHHSCTTTTLTTDDINKKHKVSSSSTTSKSTRVTRSSAALNNDKNESNNNNNNNSNNVAPTKQNNKQQPPNKSSQMRTRSSSSAAFNVPKEERKDPPELLNGKGKNDPHGSLTNGGSEYANDTMLLETKQQHLSKLAALSSQLTSLEESTSTHKSPEEEDYDFKGILPIDEIRSTKCYNHDDECFQQAAVKFANAKDPSDVYYSCIKCLTKDCGTGLDKDECKGITLSTAHRQEIVETSNGGDDMDFPSTILHPSDVTERGEVLRDYSHAARQRRLELAVSSGKTSDKPPPCSGVLPGMTANDIPTDEELKKANRPNRKPDPKSKARRVAAAKLGYELRDGSERQNELYALRNAIKSSLWPNITSESFELVSTEEYNEGYNGDPDFFKNNVYLRCLVCRQLIKAHNSNDATNLTTPNIHAGPCAELKRTGKIDDQGRCACNATKDHAEFRGKQAHAFVQHAESCHGTHCPKCGKDFDNWTSRKCKQPKVLSFRERSSHVSEKTLKAHKEWEEEQKKRD